MEVTDDCDMHKHQPKPNRSVVACQRGTGPLAIYQWFRLGCVIAGLVLLFPSHLFETMLPLDMAGRCVLQVALSFHLLLHPILIFAGRAAFNQGRRRWLMFHRQPPPI